MADAAPDVWADLAAGEPPVLLADLRDQPYMPRPGGKKLDKSVPFRWRSRGVNGRRLEVANSPTGLFTTRSAVLRFFASMSGVRPQTVGQQRRTRERQLAAADRELAAAGI
jgi:hypothetical protein